jgi:hypothetical protein
MLVCTSGLIVSSTFSFLFSARGTSDETRFYLAFTFTYSHNVTTLTHSLTHTLYHSPYYTTYSTLLSPLLALCSCSCSCAALNCTALNWHHTHTTTAPLHHYTTLHVIYFAEHFRCSLLSPAVRRIVVPRIITSTHSHSHSLTHSLTQS